MTEELSRQATLDIDGMTCASCVARVEKKLTSIDGVDAQVSLALETAKVRVPAGVTDDDLVAAVKRAGYDSHVRHDVAAHDSETNHNKAEHSHEAGHQHDVEDVPGQTPLKTRLIWSAILTVPVVILGMIPATQFPAWQWVSLVLTVPVVVWGGWPFHIATLRNARHGAATMDTLITLGTIAALAWSVWALFFGSAGEIGMRHEFKLFGEIHDPSALVYFEVAAAVTVFLLLGRFIEQRSKRDASAALRSLMELGAKDVLLAHADGSDAERVSIDALRHGQLFIAKPGEKIATDGVVVSGSSSVNESMLTGESVPVDVTEGSKVTGGTISTDGRLVVRAEAVGADTRLAHMARLVEDAQTNKGRVQRLADRISGVFVPIVIVLAVVTLIAWIVFDGSVAAGFTAAVAVLIIACPCALGLATPVAILVGTGRGAELGILITGPEAIEAAGRINVVAVDKTGTLTTGDMKVHEVVTTGDTPVAEVLRFAAAVERASEHPIARAITNAVPDPEPVDRFRNAPGRGITGVVADTFVFAGRPEFAQDFGLTLSPELLTRIEQEPLTVVVVGWGADESSAEVKGAVFVGDTLREDSVAAVKELEQLGVDVVLLTGDNNRVAQQVADEVGISRVVAGATPEGKIREIESLQQHGLKVAMIGDGVNDAAALAAADLGIAMGGGTDAAMHASDITLVRESLTSAVQGIRLSRRTMSTIKGNLFWAFGYNVAAIPLAAFGLLNPMIAGAAMAFSSVFVVLNSLRLRRFR